MIVKNDVDDVDDDKDVDVDNVDDDKDADADDVDIVMDDCRLTALTDEHMWIQSSITGLPNLMKKQNW